MTTRSVLVVGAGIAGLACARAAQKGGMSVRVVDRGRRPGGRMSGRRLHGRMVDLGASYFTADPEAPFADVVRDWVSDGRAREWTDSFAVADADGIRERRSGPMRYAAAAGLRELVIDLGRGLVIEQERVVERVSADRFADGARHDAVVLAMPDPQALRVLAADVGVREGLSTEAGWEPVIAVALGWDRRRWPVDLHGAFVNDSAAVGFIADDGDRRGDGAPVLVAHSTPELARRHLDDPAGAIAPVASQVTRILGIDAAPEWTHAHRWTFARPTAPHAGGFALEDGIGVCGDAWGGKPSVGAAWTSGDALGRALARRLGGA